MDERKRINLKDIIEQLNLGIIYMPEGKDIYVEARELNRPGLQLSGYFEFFSYDRIQIIGKSEHNYFKKVDYKKRVKVLDKLFSYDIPAMIITTGMGVMDETIHFAEKYGRALLSTEKTTTNISKKLLNHLQIHLAPSTTVHGVLVDVYGIGVLILGGSNVGKSETGLELVQRGHRLVADDSVEISEIDEGVLMGKSPDLIKHFMEIRGLGIIDVRSLYGAGAIKNSKRIDMAVHLEHWIEDKYYDRLGLDTDNEEILGVKVQKLVIPVRPGRNTAMIIEVAAMNHRQKGMGYDAAYEFSKKLERTIMEKSE
ncbi:MAG: HPr(Ser) kinase/phosphatase [Clostridioides sp.]|jgi:HPr kinase/phosphorylase|nr:HPr(Ser) kinase/phosphatase [Clostridioides sp.]